MRYLIFLLLVCWAKSTIGQTGVLLNTEKAQKSYTLYCDSDNTYLIDNCGAIVRTLPYGRNDYHLHPKLLEDGTFIFIRQLGFTNYIIEEYSFDGQLIKRIEENDPDIILHYEVIKLDNGNYLTVGREILSPIDFDQLGYDSSTSFPRFMDMILELDPDGNIVWQWNIKDHIIQQRNSNQPNYGIISEHPELLDMDVPLSSFDWQGQETFMINSFDYNPELDQIAISIRKMGEIAIIDHSTTTEEAAGHTGGNSGKGGDILWRWGNPQNYGAGDASDRFLYYQHNPNWISQGPYKGMLTCFNNGLDRPGTGFNNRYSQIPVIDTKPNNGVYIIEDGQYSKDGLQLVYDKFESSTEFYSSYTSGAEFLPNGNIHITVGEEGRMFEIDPDGSIVWNYIIQNSGYIYRSEKYASDYAAFVGKDMTPTSQILSFYDCQLYTSTLDIDKDISIDYSITNNYIDIYTPSSIKYQLFNLQGISLYSGLIDGNHQIDINDLPHGLYLLTFANSNNLTKSVKIIK